MGADPPRTIRNGRELAGNGHRVVELVGTYRVRDISPYKIMVEQPDGSYTTVRHDSTVILDDGTSVQLGARPEAEHVLDGVRVRAVGSLDEAWPPRRDPDVAQPDAAPTLVAVQSVERD